MHAGGVLAVYEPSLRCILMATTNRIRAGMVGLGMIFDETYRPMFVSARRDGLFDRRLGLVDLALTGVACRTGSRAERYRADLPDFESFAGAAAVPALLDSGVDAVCIATPDNRHFEPARLAL